MVRARDLALGLGVAFDLRSAERERVGERVCEQRWGATTLFVLDDDAAARRSTKSGEAFCTVERVKQLRGEIRVPATVRVSPSLAILTALSPSPFLPAKLPAQRKNLLRGKPSQFSTTALRCGADFWDWRDHLYTAFIAEGQLRLVVSPFFRLPM